MLREGENKIDWVRGFGRSRLEKKIGGIVSVCRVCYQHMVNVGGCGGSSDWVFGVRVFGNRENRGLVAVAKYCGGRGRSWEVVFENNLGGGKVLRVTDSLAVGSFVCSYSVLLSWIIRNTPGLGLWLSLLETERKIYILMNVYLYFKKTN